MKKVESKRGPGLRIDQKRGHLYQPASAQLSHMIARDGSVWPAVDTGFRMPR